VILVISENFCFTW